MQKVKSLLCMESDEIRVIGIWGMGGMGKTTVARAVFDEFYYQFEGKCFVANVRENSKRHGLQSLQEKILSTILMEKGLKIANVYEGINMMSRLCHKRVLLVLDDVDDVDQLDALARKREWFGKGSRIIITTRNEQVVLAGNRVNEIHTLDLLNDDEALRLFSRYAFCQNSPTEEYVKPSQRVVHYAGGLPLALRVLGSFLCGRDMIEWESALERLDDIPEEKIIDILKISFEGLKDIEKQIFLDIACFFKGMVKDEVTQVLDSFGFHPVIGISVLIQKCLVNVSNGRLEMHDLIQEMGQHLARPTRLWLFERVQDVFAKKVGMEAIEGIKLDHCSTEMKFSCGPFRHMEKLRLLQVYGKRDFGFCQGPEYLPNELRWISWDGYPSKYLPESFPAEKLVCLQMPRSDIVQLWKGKKCLNKLKFIDLSYSEKLTWTLDFSWAPNLEKLNLKYCSNLKEVHPSLGDHNRLVVLDLSFCRKLWSFPSAIKMVSLETLDLSFCSKLQVFPEILVDMEKLTSLRLCGTAIKEVHPSIKKLTSLLFLDLRFCKSLRSIPSTICMLKCLKSIRICGSPRLAELPKNLEDIDYLEELLVEETSISQPPPTIVLLKKLKTLSFSRSKEVTSQSWSSFFSSWLLQPMDLVVPCFKRLDLSYCNLLEIPGDLSPLLSLEELNLSGNKFSRLPSDLFNLSRLKILELEDCTELESLQDLPPSISVLVANNCQSLKSLMDLSSRKYEWLWYVSFANCFKLTQEDQQGSSSSSVADMLLESLLQGRSVINHQISIFLPGREIPDWFCEQDRGLSLVLQLPPNWHEEIMGFAMCFVLNNGDFPELGDAFVKGSIRIGGSGNFMSAGFTINVGTRPMAGFEHVWMGYASLESFHQNIMPDPDSHTPDDWFGIVEGKGYLRISCPKIRGKCKVRLVYKTTMNVDEDSNSITSISSPLSPEGTWGPPQGRGLAFSRLPLSWKDGHPLLPSSELQKYILTKYDDLEGLSTELSNLIRDAAEKIREEFPVNGVGNESAIGAPTNPAELRENARRFARSLLLFLFVTAINIFGYYKRNAREPKE